MAYRLAQFYGVHPGQFLSEPIEALLLHAEVTSDLIPDET